MKNENSKDNKNTNPFLKKFNYSINAKFNEASKTIKKYNKKLEYGLQDKVKS
jgi:hypothetical protein